MSCSTDGGPSSTTTKIKVRHSFSTKFTSTLNKHMKEAHRSVISDTPFGWFLHLSPKVRIGRNVLNELVVKWVDSSASFLIGDKLVPMIEKDFSLGLGLSVDGKEFNLNDNFEKSSCVKYVGKKTQDLELIYKCLMKRRKKRIPCSAYCSLYVLVGISELLFPNRSGRVFPILFEIVDNLSGLGDYNWGTLVYRYLVRSLSKASCALNEGKGTNNVYVDGCTYMLQVWFCEKFMPPKGPIEKAPRILHWMNINIGDNVFKGALEMGVVDEDVDVGAINEKEKNDDQSRPKMKDEKTSAKKLLKRKLKDTVMSTIHHQQNIVADLKRKVAVLEQEVAEEKVRRKRPEVEDGGQSVGGEEPSFSAGGRTTDPTKVKTYVRKGSQRRYKSVALRTPYTGTALLRIKNE